MRRILIVLAMAVTGLIVLAYASGCGSQAAADADTLSRETYDKIVVGMTGEALKTMVGEPAKTEAKSMGGGHSMGGSTGDAMTMEYWYYQGSKGWVRIEMGDNKVSSKSGY